MNAVVTAVLTIGLVVMGSGMSPLVEVLGFSRFVQAQARTTVGFVSMQKILTEAAEAKAAAKRIEELRRMKAQDVQAKQKVLETTRLEVANAGGLFSGGRKAELQEKEKRQQTELQQAMDGAQKELQQVQNEVQNKLRKDLLGVIEGISRNRGIQLVLNTDTAVVWASTGLDLTAEVLQKINALSK